MPSDDTATIDAEIEQRTRELAALKLRRNSLASINRHLPPEVLSHVFLMLRDSLWSLQNPYTWISIIHVCHYWRELAQSTAVLWNHIQVRRPTKPELVVEMLLKSQKVALTVDLRVPYLKLNDFLDSVVLIANHMDRIRHLRIWVPEDAAESGAFRAFHHFVRRAAHAKLESLFAWGQYETWLPSFREAQPLFSSTMRELCIRVKSVTNLLAVRTAIRDMPLLTSLELHVAHWESVQDEPLIKCDPKDRVRLENLQRIYLHGPPRACAFLLDSVDCKSTTAINIRCPVTQFPSHLDQMERFDPLITILSSKINGAGGPSARQRLSGLYIRKSGIRACIVVDGWSTYHGVDVLKTRPGGQSFHVVLPKGVAPQFCEAIRQRIQDVQTLYINEADNSDRWAELVRGLPNVREMVVTGAACNVLPRILGSDERWNTRMSKHQLHGHLRAHPTLPHLQKLIIEAPPIAVEIGTMSATKDSNLKLPLLKRVLFARSQLSMGPNSITVVSSIKTFLEDVFLKAGLTSRPRCEITFSKRLYFEFEEVDDREWDTLYEDVDDYDDDDEEEYDSEDEDTDVEEYWGYNMDGHYWNTDSEENSDDWVDEDDDEDDDDDNEDDDDDDII